MSLASWLPQLCTLAAHAMMAACCGVCVCACMRVCASSIYLHDTDTNLTRVPACACVRARSIPVMINGSLLDPALITSMGYYFNVHTGPVSLGTY